MILSDRVALVTGAGRGLGAAIARELAARGADLAITDWPDTDAAGEVAAAIRARKRRVLVLTADVADGPAAGRVVETVCKQLGRLDILVNNAGITRDRVLWKMTDDDWDRVIAVNLKGAFNYIRAAAPVFRRQGGGRIVSIASINGLRGKFGQANYAASKAGLIGLTKTAARELGRFQVNVNAVAPGMIETAMMQSVPSEVREESLAETLLGRLGQPEDVARTVAFLCSDDARHITGEVVRVDGGQYV